MRRLLRKSAAAALVIAASAGMAVAQQHAPPPPGPAPAQRNPVCVRLEAQLSQVDRGNTDPQRADQIRRYEETAHRQQTELDRISAQARRLGCESRGIFALFSGGQSPQCGPLTHQMQQMRANLDKVLSDLERLRGNSGGREEERRAILASLGQNDCGPQYRQYVARSGPGGFLESLFGGGVITQPGVPTTSSNGDTYRTVCVRTCDGFYFPISFSTTPASFAQDEQVCQRMCPAAEVTLYSHRNPGEDMSQAISTSGRTYSELPTAFAFRKAFDAACSCRAPGQTWADALKHLDDQTIERGDIVVTEEQAKQLSQPVDSKGRPIAQPKGAAPKGPAPAAASTPPAGEGGKRPVRTVGPPFLPSN